MDSYDEIKKKRKKAEFELRELKLQESMAKEKAMEQEQVNKIYMRLRKDYEDADYPLYDKFVRHEGDDDGWLDEVATEIYHQSSLEIDKKLMEGLEYAKEAIELRAKRFELLTRLIEKWKERKYSDWFEKEKPKKHKE